MIKSIEVKFTNKKDLKPYKFPPGTVLKKVDRSNKTLSVYEVTTSGEIKETIRNYQELVRTYTDKDLKEVKNLSKSRLMKEYIVPSIIYYKLDSKGETLPNFPMWKEEVADHMLQECGVYECFCALWDGTLFTYEGVFDSPMSATPGVKANVIAAEFSLYARSLIGGYKKRSMKPPRYVSIPYVDGCHEVRVDLKKDLWREGNGKWLPLREMIRQAREARL